MFRTPAVRILALGSPHGDDQVAWRVAEMLRREPAFAETVFPLDSPFQLLAHFASDRPTIIIDACQSGAAPGSVLRVDAESLVTLRSNQVSSHGGSVADVIRLAEALGRKPMSLVILAVELDSCEPGEKMSAAGRRGIEQLEHELRLAITRLSSEFTLNFG